MRHAFWLLLLAAGCNEYRILPLAPYAGDPDVPLVPGDLFDTSIDAPASPADPDDEDLDVWGRGGPGEPPNDLSPPTTGGPGSETERPVIPRDDPEEEERDGGPADIPDDGFTPGDPTGDVDVGAPPLVPEDDFVPDDPGPIGTPPAEEDTPDSTPPGSGGTPADDTPPVDGSPADDTGTPDVPGDTGSVFDTALPPFDTSTPEGICMMSTVVWDYLDRFQTPGDRRVFYCHRTASGWHFLETDVSACIAHLVNHRDTFPSTGCDS